MKNIVKLFLVLTVAFTSLTADAQVSVGLSVRIAPPPIPVYEQPLCPADGYLWTPGYWAYGDDGYYWVPGVWVRPPHYGVLWTPGYWAYDGGFYGFHAGYWGPHVGFYGGVNYGYGYGGFGFGGGIWQGPVFRYNTAVMRVNTTVVRNTYIDRTVIRNTNTNRTSFNGPGGVNARPRPEDRSAMTERHFQPTRQQLSHQQNAGHDRSQFASVNHGSPAHAAMNKVNGRSFSPQGRPTGGMRSGGFAPQHNQPGRTLGNDRNNGNSMRPQQQPRSERQFAPRQPAGGQPRGNHPGGGFGGGRPAGGFGGGHPAGSGGHPAGGGGGHGRHP